ncbi:MAG: hypothetical protein F4239_01415 [Gammaproteobacteria bacterium]|nr:hypothetical protein [Gammaproteobacteria bacterium]
MLRFGIEIWTGSDGLGFHISQIGTLFFQIGLLFLVAWPCGIPLTVALQKTFRRSRITTYILGVFLIPISAMAATIGGLLGPLGVFGYVTVVSIPAWIALGILYIKQRPKIRGSKT